MFGFLCRKKRNRLIALNKSLNALLQESTDHIDELVEDNCRLTRMLADPKIIDIEIENGGINVTIGEHWAIKHLVHSFADSFGEAKNWMAIQCGPMPTEKGLLLVTIQKMDGSTPVEALRKAEAELAEAEQDEDELQGFLDRIDIQASEALESIGRFPPKPAGFPDRIDVLCDIAKKTKELEDIVCDLMKATGFGSSAESGNGSKALMCRINKMLMTKFKKD